MDTQSNNDEERLQILRMVEEGKISASEAANLLSAINSGTTIRLDEPVAAAEPVLNASEPDTTVVSPAPPSTQPIIEIGAQWLRVRVTDIASGRTKVTVNLPISLVNWGMKIGARYAPEVSEFNFNELTQLLKSGAEGKLIDVMDEEDGEHVEIFVD